MSITTGTLKFTCITIALVILNSPVQGQVINEEIRLLALDSASNDGFAYSIAIDDGGVIAVGTWQDDDNGTGSGSAYLLNAMTGAQIAKLLPTDGAEGDVFGESIAISGGIVAVGVRADDDRGTDSGSAYLFDASTGAQLFKLLPSDGGATDRFGMSVAIDDGIVAVGAYQSNHNGNDSGAAYLFDASTGIQLRILLPDDGAEGDRFGRSIAIDNGVVAVGAIFDDDNGNQSGAAYLFAAATGVQLFKLLPTDGGAYDQFGQGIDIADGIVAVGAFRADDNGSDSGAAYTFDVSTGAQVAKLLPGDGSTDDGFGWSVATSGGYVAVGAWTADGRGGNSGSAYLFDAMTGTQSVGLVPTGDGFNDYFGNSIAMVGGTVAVGAYRDTGGHTFSGSAFVFDVRALVPTEKQNWGNIKSMFR